MSTNNDDITDFLHDPEDEQRNDALLRGVTLHGRLEFNGRPIRPVSAGSMAIMEKTRNGWVTGDVGNKLFDTAAFVILHTEDENLFRAAVRAAWSPDWPAFVVNWLDATHDAQALLVEFAPKIAELMNDYGKALSRIIDTETKPGNAGGRIG